MRSRLALFSVIAAATVAACAAPPGAEPRRGALRGAATEQLLPWGSGATAVGLRAPGAERLAAGPSAVAVAPDGALLVLDRLNRRVLRLADDGRAPEVVAPAPADADDLAVGDGGALALYSRLRARVWVHADGGVAELAVPRALRGVRGVALGPSRQVLVDTDYQETFALGSPSVPQTEAAVLAQKREGVVRLDDGRGVAVHLLADGRPELLLRRPGDRLDAADRVDLPERVLAARVVGAAGRAVCLRLERADVQVDVRPATGAGVAVRRTLVCHDVDGGARLLRRDLPAPGLYLPAREIAVGGTPARVAFLEATAAGLRVRSVPLPAQPEEVAP